VAANPVARVVAVAANPEVADREALLVAANPVAANPVAARLVAANNLPP
jgi:hypothetical protein